MTRLSSCIILLLNCYAVSSLVYNNWITITNPSLPRVIYSGASGYDSHTNTIYLVGGYTNTKTLISYDISNNVFNDFGVSYFDIDVWNWGQWYTQRANQLWFIDVGGLYFNVFNMSTQSLTTNYNGITIDQPVDKDGCLASYNNYLLVIGSATKAQIYNLATDTWLPDVPQLQTSRNAAMCAVINDEIYAIAGYSAVNTIEYLDIHDIPNIQNYAWIYMSGTLTRTYRWRTVIYDNQIVILGGCCAQTSDIFTINPITKTLSNAGNLNYAIHSTSPIIANDIFYVFGGNSVTSWMYHVLPTTTSTSTNSPTNIPTQLPTKNPTLLPTNIPTFSPSNNPTTNPSHNPTANPSTNPSQYPTQYPIISPTITTVHPSESPTLHPTLYPSVIPSKKPTPSPTFPEGAVIIDDTQQPVVTSDHDDLQSQNSQSSVFNKSNILMYIIIGCICIIVICCVIFSVCFYKKKVNKKSAKHIETNMNTNMEGTATTTGNKMAEMVQLGSISPVSTSLNLMSFETAGGVNEGGVVEMDTHSDNEEEDDVDNDLFGDTVTTGGQIVNDDKEQLPELPDNNDEHGMDNELDHELYMKQVTTAGADIDINLKHGLNIPGKIFKLCTQCGKSQDANDGGKVDENDMNWYCHNCWDSFQD